MMTAAPLQRAGGAERSDTTPSLRTAHHRLPSATMLILTVEQLVGTIKDVLETEPLLQDAWVQGEVSNLSRSAAGHLYFTLKDAGGQVRCVLFRHQARYQSYTPANGALVVVHGRVSLYEASGALQLYVDLVQADGIGAAALELERLRQRLAAEGLFDEHRKRPLPAFPRCIGVVTSAQGAVWHDIKTVIARRFPSVVLVLAPAQVQGADAPASIVAGLRRLWELDCCDVIIVGRGGGSAEDLWAFNDEQVARAIYASPAPVISAVGHEVDYTIADLVADVRAPTPSAAAELAVPDRQHLLAELAGLRDRLCAAAGARLSAARAGLDAAGRRLGRSSPQPRLVQQRQRLDDLAAGLTAQLTRRLERHDQAVGALAGRLRALDPRAVLARGYAVVTLAGSGAVVASVGAVAAGDRLRVHVRDGWFGARVAPPAEETR
jgi:exodeoxyribonuclease VII large subunit